MNTKTLLLVGLSVLASGCNGNVALNATVSASPSTSPTVSGTVTTGTATTNFTLSLSSVSPVVAPATGFTLTLNGNFQSGIAITIGGTACGSMVITSTQVTCQVPALSSGAKDVQVTYAAQTATLTSAVIINPTPTLASLSPTQSYVAGGSTLTLTGTGFLPSATVKIGSVSCPVLAITSTQITCTIPSQGAAAYSVTVTNTDNQTASLSSAFSYTLTPSIASLTDANLNPTTVISPNAGSVMNVMGSGFSAGAVVKLNGTACSTTTVVSSNQLTCTQTGATASGKYTVTVLSGGQTATAPSQIRYAKATKLFRNQFYNGAALMSDGSVFYWQPLGRTMFSTQAQGAQLAHPLLSTDCATELTGVTDLAVTPDGNTIYAVLSNGKIQYYDGLNGNYVASAAFTSTVQGAGSLGTCTAVRPVRIGYVPNLTAATAVAAGNDYGCAVNSSQLWCWGNSNNIASMNPSPPASNAATTYFPPYHNIYFDGQFVGSWSIAATNTQFCITYNGGATNNASMTYCSGTNVMGYAAGLGPSTPSASPGTWNGVSVLSQAQANTYKGFAGLSSGGNLGMCGASPTGKDIVCWNGAYDDVTFGIGAPQQIYSTGGSVYPTSVSIVSDQALYATANSNINDSSYVLTYLKSTSHLQATVYSNSLTANTFFYGTSPGAVCGLFSDNSIHCSGATGMFGEGLRGDGNTTQNLGLVHAAPGSAQTNSFGTSVLLQNGTALAATQISSECAIDMNGAIYCWAGNQEIVNAQQTITSGPGAGAPLFQYTVTTDGAFSIDYNAYCNTTTTPGCNNIPANTFSGKAVAMTFGN